MEIRNSIYATLSPVLLNKGFRLIRTEQSFIRPILGGRQAIGIAIVDYKPKFKFSLTVSVRIDKVEDIIHLFSGSPPEYHKASSTFNCAMQRFTSPETEFEILTDADLKTKLSYLTLVANDQIVPFLDQNNDLETLAKAMNLTTIPEIVPGVGPAMHAATAAWLTHHPEFSAVVTGYRERMKYLPKDVQERFNSLVQHLEMQSPN